MPAIASRAPTPTTTTTTTTRGVAGRRCAVSTPRARGTRRGAATTRLFAAPDAGSDAESREAADAKGSAHASSRAPSTEGAGDLVARLRSGAASSSASAGGAVHAGESAASRGAARRAMRERDAVTKSVLAVALGLAAMMPTITAEAPTPHPVTVGAKRTIVAGAVKNVATDARGKVDKAEEAFFRDVERYVGTISV